MNVTQIMIFYDVYIQQTTDYNYAMKSYIYLFGTADNKVIQKLTLYKQLIHNF